MKYILIIGFGAVVIALLLTFVIDHFFGNMASSFFIKFLTVPIGLGVSFLIFMIYDTKYPKRKELASKKQDKDRI